MRPMELLPDGAYEISETVITPNDRPVFGNGLGGGTRRGTGGRSRHSGHHAPNVSSEFNNELKFYKIEADADYAPRFSSLEAESLQQVEHIKANKKNDATLSPAQAATEIQSAVLDLIDDKKTRYLTIAPDMYGMHGKSPYFLMEVLPLQMTRALWQSKDLSRESLQALWKHIDDVYRTALEAKSLSLSIDTIAGRLFEIAQYVEQSESGYALTNQQQQKHMNTIGREQVIHLQQLPNFLQNELATSETTKSEALSSAAISQTATTMRKLATAHLAAVGPIIPPPPFDNGYFVIRRAPTNPHIKAPLSKPELEALNELVFLQNNTNIGRKWVSYHDALLKQESARYLNRTAAAFENLADRAEKAENIMDAVKFTVDAGKEITSKYGEKAAIAARALSEHASGKKIRNAHQAIQAFEKYKHVLDRKFGVKDREAISKALAAMDGERIAKDLIRFGKAFGIAGDAIDIHDVSQEIQKSTQSGDWLPVFIKLETIFLGKAASATLAVAFGIVAGSALGILGYALLMALVGSAITDERIGELNEFISDVLP